MIGNADDGNNFPHKAILINTQVLRFCKTFGDNSSTNINLSETELHKLEQIRIFKMTFRIITKNRLVLNENVL